MKILQRALLLVALTTPPAFAAGAIRHSVQVLSTKRDVFYFKVRAEFKGATIHVTSPDGEVILTGTVNHHRAMVDFYFENPGRYSITIRNAAGQEENFEYVKSSASPFVEVAQRRGITLHQ